MGWVGGNGLVRVSWEQRREMAIPVNPSSTLHTLHPSLPLLEAEFTEPRVQGGGSAQRLSPTQDPTLCWWDFFFTEHQKQNRLHLKPAEERLKLKSERLLPETQAATDY